MKKANDGRRKYLIQLVAGTKTFSEAKVGRCDTILFQKLDVVLRHHSSLFQKWPSSIIKLQKHLLLKINFPLLLGF